MKSVEISGVAKVEAYNGAYAGVKINGVPLASLVADQLIETTDEAILGETSICRVTISIEPYAHTLSVNGVEMELEL